MKSHWIFELNKTSGWMETHSLFLPSSRISRSSTSCALMSCKLLLLISASILSRVTQGVQVTGGNITVVQGETAILPCKLTDTEESLTQISWQRKTIAYSQNRNFFTVPADKEPEFFNGKDNRFQFLGNIIDFIGSLQLSNVKVTDEGVYTCIFTLFPSGNHKTEILLNVLVPPVTSLKDNCPTLGNEAVTLVTCTAAGSRPPAKVRWRNTALIEKVRETTNTIQHDNGTTTTINSLFGVPTRNISQHSVECVVTSEALSKEKNLFFTIQVYFSPMEVTISNVSNKSFQCVTEANPHPNITWSRSKGLWPQSAVRAEGPILQFLSMTSDLNGEYQCTASNRYGRKNGVLYLHVTSGVCTVCWVLFGILLVLNVAGAAVWYWFKSRTGERQPVPTISGAEEDQTADEAI